MKVSRKELFNFPGDRIWQEFEYITELGLEEKFSNSLQLRVFDFYVAESKKNGYCSTLSPRILVND